VIVRIKHKHAQMGRKGIHTMNYTKTKKTTLLTMCEKGASNLGKRVRRATKRQAELVAKIATLKKGGK
jgi:hypothetical protein